MDVQLLDAGPLAAYLNPHDEHHKWAVAQFKKASPPLVTCDAALSEACFLLRQIHEGPDRALELVARRAIVCDFDLQTEIDVVRSLIAKYRNVPMSLADACLVRMSELQPKASVITVDSDFRIYRRNTIEMIPVIMPPALSKHRR